MSFVATLFQPFLAFLGTYKWYILIFILLYLALTIVFRHSRELITVVFGTLIIIFVITHLGDVYVTLNHLWQPYSYGKSYKCNKGNIGTLYSALENHKYRAM